MCVFVCVCVWMCVCVGGCDSAEYDLDGYLGVSPKLCSPDEVIKEGRAVCSGYSSICLEMCRYKGSDPGLWKGP